MNPFDTIDVWALLGDAKRKEICAQSLPDEYVSNIRKEGRSLPFYFYPSEAEIKENKTSYLNKTIVNKIAEKLRLRFINEKENEEDIQENASPVCYANSDEVSDDFKLDIFPLTFTAIDILDYIYAVLHSSTYRKKYKEFLKIDFLQVPFPGSIETAPDLSLQRQIFWKLVKLGGELRQIHLQENPEVDKSISLSEADGLIKEIDEIEI